MRFSLLLLDYTTPLQSSRYGTEMLILTTTGFGNYKKKVTLEIFYLIGFSHPTLNKDYFVSDLQTEVNASLMQLS